MSIEYWIHTPATSWIKVDSEEYFAHTGKKLVCPKNGFGMALIRDLLKLM